MTAPEPARRHYWATAASPHYHFRDVLTYLFNAAHHNHIHIDNTVSGGTSNWLAFNKASMRKGYGLQTY